MSYEVRLKSETRVLKIRVDLGCGGELLRR